MSCCKITIGQLNKTIQLIDKDLVPTNCDITFDLTPKAIIKAKIQSNTSIGNRRAIFDNTNLSDAISHVFTIRYRSDIQADDLIKYDKRYFTIQQFIDIDENKKWLVIGVVERGDVTNTRNQF
jgi:SPP1 family predicted phage head-tail adaptor